MTASQIKKQMETYLPLLSIKQQELLLDMAKNILHIEPSNKRITKKQYHKEIAEAEARINKGNYKTHEQALKELSEW